MTTNGFADAIRRMSHRHEGWRSASVDFDEEYKPVNIAWIASTANDWYIRGDWDVTFEATPSDDAKEKPIGIDELI